MKLKSVIGFGLLAWASWGSLLVAVPHAAPISPASVVAGSSGQQIGVPATETVRLVIRHGDGTETHYPGLPHRAEMTVHDAMRAASRLNSPRALKFEATGQGELLFVNSIAGQANEGNRGGKRNWIYRINGKLGTVSCGVAKVQPGDEITWTFTDAGLAP